MVVRPACGMRTFRGVPAARYRTSQVFRALPMTNSSPAGAVWFAVSIVPVSVSTLSDDWLGAISRLLPAAAAASRIVCSQARATVTVRRAPRR